MTSRTCQYIIWGLFHEKANCRGFSESGWSPDEYKPNHFNWTPNAKKRVAANLIPSMVKKLKKKGGVEQMIPTVFGYNLRGGMLRKSFVCAPKCFTGAEDGQEMQEEEWRVFILYGLAFRFV